MKQEHGEGPVFEVLYEHLLRQMVFQVGRSIHIPGKLSPIYRVSGILNEGSDAGQELATVHPPQEGVMYAWPCDESKEAEKVAQQLCHLQAVRKMRIQWSIWIGATTMSQLLNASS